MSYSDYMNDPLLGPYNRKTEGPNVIYAAEVSKRRTENRDTDAICNCKSASACKTARCGCHKSGVACHDGCACTKPSRAAGTECNNKMGDLAYIFGDDPEDRPARLSGCLISKIMSENVKKPDGARVWWGSVKGKIWEDSRRRADSEEGYLWESPDDAAMARAQAYGALSEDEKAALKRRSFKHWFGTDSYYFYSFCRDSIQQIDCTSHCSVCNACVPWRYWHCRICNKCTYGLNLPCSNCSRKGIRVFHASKKDMESMFSF
ncbi:hypothetical protein C8R45DRAFT_1213575 [Mycena sanguinolenta]|nr:hypothetical protein C8R45DRAFT_1213575 [Mycena sanguinolenta]